MTNQNLTKPFSLGATMYHAGSFTALLYNKTIVESGHQCHAEGDEYDTTSYFVILIKDNY